VRGRSAVYLGAAPGAGPGAGGERAGTPGPDDLGRRTASGLNWTVLASFVRAFASFGIGVLLARLLPPEDFGVVAAAYVVTGLVYVIAESGFAPALVQRAAVSDRQVRLCHTVAVLLGGGAAAAVYFGAAPVAGFFRDPDVGRVLRILAFASLFSAFGLTSRALLLRQLRFRALVHIELVASILGYGGIAVALAWAGFGYWSLVFGTLSQAVLSALLSYTAVRHSIRPLLATAELRDLLGFSAGISLVNLANFFAVKGDYLVIGRVLDAASLGFYSRAFTLMELPMVVFGASLGRVLFPAASHVQGDPERFRRAYLLAISVSMSLAVPVSLGMMVVAPELIHVIYGVAWAPAAPLLQILCAFGMFRVTYNTASAFLKARGHAYQLLIATLVYGFLVVVGTAWAVKTAGLSAVPWAVGFAITAMWLLVVGMVNGSASVPFRPFLRDITLAVLPGTVLALGTYVCVLLLRAAGSSSLLILVFAILTTAIGTLGIFLLQVRRSNHVTLNSAVDRWMGRIRPC
jgi:lipopolysaccharide exporter